MRAAVITAPGEVGTTTFADPSPALGEVVVAVAACGICGTDLHLVDGHVDAPLPLVPGHELTGEVVALGAGVVDLHVGDRVAVDPNQPCGGCRPCRRGRQNLCERYAALGVTMAGGAAEYVAAPARSCVRLPDGVDLAQAALIEPLSCAVRGFDVLQLPVGDRVLIYGAGTMGLMNLALALRAGAGSVDVVDLDPGRLDRARALGARHAVTAPDEVEAPDGWDAVIDCTGVIAAIEDGLSRVGRGGTFLQFGVAPQHASASWSPFRVYRDEIRIVGSMAVLHSFERAAELFAEGAVDADALITDRFPLEGYAAAISAFRSGAGLKLQILPSAPR
jgi:2-desacetyl-2-hydroxyethyl bacteriochlorophyllide A dehydrogenase